MSSLTATSAYARNIFIIVGGFLLLILILFVGYNLFSPFLVSFFPQKPDPALVAFGKLPDIKLDDGIKPGGDIIYKIETISGDLKEQQAKLKVFKIGTNTVKFGDLSRVNSIAQTIKFPVPPISVTNETATYQDQIDKNKILEIGILSSTFVLKSDYLNNPDVIANQEKNEAGNKQSAIALLRSFGINQADYPPEKMSLVRYKIDGGKLAQATTLASTNLEQVNFNHSDIGNITVTYPKYQKPKIKMLTAAGRVLSADVYATDLQLFSFSTYPLKGVQKAFSDLKAGKAIYNKELGGNIFNIRDIKMSYLDTYADEEFLQPVYVFVSDDGLEAYVRAVSDTYIISN